MNPTARSIAAKLQAVEKSAAVSSIKGKLSKKPAGSGTSGSSEGARKTALSREELLANQERHRQDALAKGKAVPYYRK